MLKMLRVLKQSRDVSGLLFQFLAASCFCSFCSFSRVVGICKCLLHARTQPFTGGGSLLFQPARSIESDDLSYDCPMYCASCPFCMKRPAVPAPENCPTDAASLPLTSFLHKSRPRHAGLHIYPAPPMPWPVDG